MTAFPVIGNSKPANQLPGSNSMNLNAQDFIKMMVTQLQNQDPMQPADNSQLLSQMSQIGQLQASTDLQSSLKGLALQNQIGSASSLIGKVVQGLDAQSNSISGLVNSVQVAGGNVTLQLDNGKALDITKVTTIAPAPTGATAATPTTGA